MNNILATISIYSSNRQINSIKINEILSENAKLIISRMGVNVERRCSSSCSAVIVLCAKGEEKQIKKLKADLAKIKETKVKLNIL